MEDVTSASSVHSSGPAPPAVLTPESRLSHADSRVPPRPPPNRGTGRRSAEKHPHGPQASGILRLRTQLQPELGNPGPEPRFRLARAAVASGTGSPASGSWVQASRYSKAYALCWSVEARASPLSQAPSGDGREGRRAAERAQERGNGSITDDIKNSIYFPLPDGNLIMEAVVSPRLAAAVVSRYLKRWCPSCLD
ncbi:hypothetical protein STEG23_030175 [Scotinomys teguina]